MSADNNWLAVTSEHCIVRMRIRSDRNGNAMNVGTCRCGKQFGVPRNGGGLEGTLDRLAQMDALIAAHHAEVLRTGGCDGGARTARVKS
jgi:hypothetical protein